MTKRSTTPAHNPDFKHSLLITVHLHKPKDCSSPDFLIPLENRTHNLHDWRCLDHSRHTRPRTPIRNFRSACTTAASLDTPDAVSHPNGCYCRWISAAIAAAPISHGSKQA